MDEVEQWKRIPWAPKYKVSSFGRVKSFHKSKTGQILKPYWRRGSLYVNVYFSGRQTRRPVARLVYDLFGDMVGKHHRSLKKRDPDALFWLSYVDGDRSNVRISNLEWDSLSDQRCLCCGRNLPLWFYESGHRICKRCANDLRRVSPKGTLRNLHFGVRFVEYMSGYVGYGETIEHWRIRAFASRWRRDEAWIKRNLRGYLKRVGRDDIVVEKYEWTRGDVTVKDVLDDADKIGAKEAAKRYGVCERTIVRWRKRHGRSWTSEKWAERESA